MALLYLLVGSAAGLSPAPKLGLGRAEFPSLPAATFTSGAFGSLLQKAVLTFHEPLPGVLKCSRTIFGNCFGLLCK